MNKCFEKTDTATDAFFERDHQKNKSDNWNKINKTTKIQKLHEYAEQYGKTNNYSAKEVNDLKHFFCDSLEKQKLQKTKDVIYDKETHKITSIPALYFNTNTHNFSLKIMDAKRVSTIKSLTPKRQIKTLVPPPTLPPSEEGPSEKLIGTINTNQDTTPPP